MTGVVLGGDMPGVPETGPPSEKPQPQKKEKANAGIVLGSRG